MQPSDRADFARALADVMAYYGRDCSPFMLEIFWKGLAGHEFEDVSRALTLHARDPDHGQFAPKLADITRLLEGTTNTQGARAWSKVERAVKSVGKYRSVVFDDPLIHVVITEMGGWTSLCAINVEDLPFKARDFERRYSAYRLRREVPSFPPHLIGEHEAENRLNAARLGGLEWSCKPVLIGDVERAQRVLERGSEQPALRFTDSAKAAAGVLAALTRGEKREA